MSLTQYVAAFDMKSEGTFAKQGKGGFARVLLEIEFGASHPSVEIALNDDEWNNQLRQGNFSDWFDGAIYGIQFALRVAGITDAAVQVKRIVGLEVDSNPTNTAAAAADAIWKATGFEVPQAVEDKINHAVLQAWKHPSKLHPCE